MGRARLETEMSVTFGHNEASGRLHSLANTAREGLAQVARQPIAATPLVAVDALVMVTGRDLLGMMMEHEHADSLDEFIS